MQMQSYRGQVTFKFQLRTDVILISLPEGTSLVYIWIIVSTLIFTQILAPSRFYLVLLNLIPTSDSRAPLCLFIVKERTEVRTAQIF